MLIYNYERLYVVSLLCFLMFVRDSTLGVQKEGLSSTALLKYEKE